MIDSIAGNVSFLESLDTLKDQFTGSVVHQQKILEFGEFGGWRRCRGDGNCFYRACGFAFVESLLREGPGKLKPAVDVMRTSSKGEAESLLGLLTDLCAVEPTAALDKFYRKILLEESVDAELVRVMRLVSAHFVMENQEVDFNGLPLTVYVEASHGMSLDAFCSTEILTNGTEAESVALTLVPLALGLKIEIIQLDRTDSAIQRYQVPDGRPGNVFATLLFKPGHYDIIYRSDVACELLLLQKQLQLRAECQKRPACVICMDDSEAEPLPCGCAYCAECLTDYKTSGATACAVCKVPFL